MLKRIRNFLAGGNGSPRKNPIAATLRASKDLSRRKQVVETVRSGFDPDYYLATYTDIASVPNLDPLDHFCKFGWKEGRDPSKHFSTTFYLRTNPDVAAAGVNPFWHYLVFGQKEGRPSLPEPSLGPAKDISLHAQEMETIRAEFDPGFYLSTYPDVAAVSSIDPLEHFCLYGWREGRDPSASFSTSYYLNSNPDIAEARINPFWHYIVAGKPEGRQPHHPGGYKVEALINAVPLEEKVIAWRSSATPSEMLSATQIFNRLIGASDTGHKQVVISVGHDNYRKVSGGVQFCIFREEQRAVEDGFLYLNIHPFQPLPRLAHLDQDPDVPVTLLLSGELLGTAAMSELIAAVKRLTAESFESEVIVHHLLGHNPEQVSELVRATGQDSCWFWVHDFFSICPSPGLQRNSVSPCNAPDVSSNACSLCLYGAERRAQQDRFARFFDELTVRVVAPSQFAARFWSEKARLKSSDLVVSEHMVVDQEIVQAAAQKAGEGPIRVAYLGFPGPYKGWPTFQRLVRNFGHDPRFKFYYFGNSHISHRQIETVDVHVTAEDPDAMIRAIESNSIDLVLHWATCGETFSISTHEALAAGANIITNSISGNVAETVKKMNVGMIMENESELEAFFKSDKVEKSVTASRTKSTTHRPVLRRSDVTIPMLKVGART